MADPTEKVVAFVPLNRANVERLAAELLAIVKAHYLSDEKAARSKVFEILNALATVSATVIGGTNDQRAAAFFMKAMDTQLSVFAGGPGTTQ